MCAKRALVKDVERLEGAKAYEDGLSVGANPYAKDRDMNTFQWHQGWSNAADSDVSAEGDIIKPRHN